MFFIPTVQMIFDRMNERLRCRIPSTVQNQMKNLLFYVCCFVCISHGSRSQVNDHSNRVINDSIYFAQCEDSLRKYLNTNLPKAKLVAKNSLTFADSSGNIQWQVLARLMVSSVLIHEKGETNAIESIRLCKEALELSETAGDSLFIMKVAINLSNSYRQIHQLSEALQWSSRAIGLASDLEEKEMLYKALTTRARIYQDLGFYNRALKDYEMLDSVLETNHYSLRGANFYNKGNLYQMHLNDPEQAWLNYKHAYDLFKENNSAIGLLPSAVALGVFYTGQKEYVRAKKYFHEALQLADSLNIVTQKVTIHQYLAQVYQFQGRIDSAFYHIDKSLDLADTLHNLNQQMQSLKFKAVLTEQSGDSITALKYHRMAAILEDSLERRKNLTQATKVLIRNEAQEYEEQLSVYQRLLKNKNSWIWITLASILILGVVGIFIIRRYRSRLSSVRRTENKLSQTLQTEKETKEHLNRQLVSKAAHLAVQHELLDKTYQLLDKIKKHVDLAGLSEKVNDAQINIRDQLELDRMWETFFEQFEKVHPDFSQQLASRYNLTQHDLRLCAFIKMNLTRKEIAQIMHINPNSLNVSLHRLKKKLHLTSEVSVHEFLHSSVFNPKSENKMI